MHCGLPRQKYRGNRALSRYEFAAGLNACLDRINELLAAATADLVRKEDLVAVQRLQQEFAAELAALRGRVDALEARTTTLEKQQFSTTTKLSGEVIFSLASAYGAYRGGNPAFINNTNPATGAIPRAGRDAQVVFNDRVRLNLQTSFTGKDLLITGLQAYNFGGGPTAAIPGFSTGVVLPERWVMAMSSLVTPAMCVCPMNHSFPPLIPKTWRCQEAGTASMSISCSTSSR